MATIRTPKLINVEYLKAYSQIPLNFNYEEVILYSPIAEQLWVEPLLGNALYEELLDQVETNTLTELNSTLILKVYPYLANAIVYEALPFLYANISEVGIQKGKSDNTDSVDLKDMRYLSDHVLGIIEFQKKQLIEWLEEYKEYYPLYISKNESCSCSLNKSKTLKHLYTNRKYNKTKNIK